MGQPGFSQAQKRNMLQSEETLFCVKMTSKLLFTSINNLITNVKNSSSSTVPGRSFVELVHAVPVYSA